MTSSNGCALASHQNVAILHLEPSLDALSLRSEVIRSIKILSSLASMLRNVGGQASFISWRLLICR